MRRGGVGPVEHQPADRSDSSHASPRRHARDLSAREQDRRIDAPAVLRFVVATVIATSLFAATFAAFVLTEPGQRLENLGLAGADLRGSEDRLESLGNLSHISVLSFGSAILLVLVIAVARRLTTLGLVIGLVMGLSVVLAEVLKEVLPRPELFPAQAWLHRNTFPSGHATVAAALGVGAVLVAPMRLRWVAVAAAATYASAIGQATQIAGWHRLSGAIGGVLLVMAVASLALAVLADRGLLTRSSAGRGHPRIVVGLFGVAGGIVVVAGLIAVLPVAFPLLVAPRGSEGAFVHTSLDLIGVGVTFAMFVAFGVLLEPFSLGRSSEARNDTGV